MRYNRIWLMLTLLAAVFILGGCMNVQDLTDKEADIVAEYSAGILLRYSDQYERRLITRENGGQSEIAVPTPTPEAALSPDESVTAAPSPDVAGGSTDSTGDTTGGTSETDTTDGNTDGADVAGSEPAEDDSSQQVSLNDLFHIKGLDLSYKSYQFCDKYPSKSDNVISPITAGDGETLLVVHFQIRNKSGKKKKFSLGRKRIENISYKLNADGNEYQPDINILKNTGLNYLNTTLKKGGKEDAVLVYRMAKERRQASSISLQIKEGNKAVNLQLK